MHISRFMLAPALALVGLFALAPLVLAQVPAWTVAQGGDGALYLVTSAGRYGLSPTQLSDDQLAAMPDLGLLGAELPVQPRTQVVLDTPVTFSETGTLNTRPFDLQGGTYTATWVAVPGLSSKTCFHGSSLRPVTKGGSFISENLGSGLTADGKPGSGETQLYNVPAGQYYVDANSTCSWSVSIATQR